MVAALTAACAPGQRPCRRRPPRPHPHPGTAGTRSYRAARVSGLLPGVPCFSLPPPGAHLWPRCQASLVLGLAHALPRTCPHGHALQVAWASRKGCRRRELRLRALGNGSDTPFAPALFGGTGVPAAGSPRPCGRISSSGPHQPPTWEPEGVPSPGSALYPSRSRRDPGLGCPSCDPGLGCRSP